MRTIEEVGKSENDRLADPGGVALEETIDECLDSSRTSSQFRVMKSWEGKAIITTVKCLMLKEHT